MVQTQLQRTILWIVFGLSLLLLWDRWQAHHGRSSMFSPRQAAETPTPRAQDDATVPSATPGSAVPAGSAHSAAPVSGTGKILTLRNDVLAVGVDTLGGVFEHAELLTQRDADDRTRNVVLLQNDPGAVYLAQSGWVGAPQGTSFPTHRTPFAVVEGPSATPDGARLVLTAESGGLKVVRTLSLPNGSYVVEQQDELTNTGDIPLAPTQYVQLTRDHHKPPGESKFYSTYTGPVIYSDKAKFKKVDFGDIEKGKKDLFEKNAADGWVGIIQHYFVAAWVPADKMQREFYADKVDDTLFRVGAKLPQPELAPQASVPIESRLLVAPQDQRMLEQVAPGLDLVVDYGWLTVIAKPIYWLLSFLHSVVGNWGWSIVLLTIVIKTIFFPLQAASYKSMARMKAVTPRLTAIRERYASDRVKMNEAMMQLYKEEKINPLGGCLPIVVQIPVFIALYWVLLASVEMRAAPWLGWIHDLAAPDPFYVLPLIMAGTMFLQTKLNPTPPDPVQAKMMMIMPLVFSVMFFFFPAGLVLYWLVNNVYSIIQQSLITRRIEAGKDPGKDKGKAKT
jgi:YidC/Oxa1 family membrane protein insertase